MRRLEDEVQLILGNLFFANREVEIGGEREIRTLVTVLV